MTRIAREKRPVVSDQLHARLLFGFDELVRELGGDPARIADDARLGPLATTDSYRATTTLLEAAARLLDCADFGLRLARRQGGATLGPLSLVMHHSPTFADALAYVAGHSQAHSHAARIWIERDRTDGRIFVGHDILLPGPPFWSQAIEQILLLGHLGAIKMTGGAARVRGVHFRHQPLSPRRTYRRHFGCDVRFGQPADGIVFLDDDFAQPIVDTDTEAYRAATADVEARFPARKRPVHVDARAYVMRQLASGACSNDDIAMLLKLHPRTFHRRLEAEGTSFQRVKDDVRRDVMLYYLCQTQLDLLIISERLGFAEQAVMTRFCRKLFDASPTDVRKRFQREEAVVAIAATR